MARNAVKPAAASEPIEGPWALPEGWCWQRLGDAVEVHDKLRRPLNQSERNARQHHNPNAELYPYYGATGQVGEIDGYLADGEYVLLGEDGAPFLDRDKNKAYLVSGRFWANNHAHVLKAGKLFGNKWLLHWLNTIDYRGIVNGTTRLKLTQGAMNEMPVPVPLAGREEQIIARIDELFTEADDGEAALEQARGDLATWRKALLKAAVTGELTADWRAANPPTESGPDLLARILKDRRTRWLADPRNKGKRYFEPAGPDVSSQPDPPEGWVWTNIGQLAIVDSGGTPPGLEAAATDVGEVPWFKVSSMSLPGNERELKTSKWWLLRQQALNAGLRIFPAGALVFPKLGGALLTNKRRLLAVDGCLDLNNMAVVSMPAVKDYVWALFSGIDLADLSDGSVVPQLKRQAVEKIQVCLPPPNELSKLVSLLEHSFRALAELGGELNELHNVSSVLRQSILSVAFRGDLVA